jgi:hypothetical protein
LRHLSSRIGKTPLKVGEFFLISSYPEKGWSYQSNVVASHPTARFRRWAAYRDNRKDISMNTKVSSIITNRVNPRLISVFRQIMVEHEKQLACGYIYELQDLVER